jgi:hypothetical protein
MPDTVANLDRLPEPLRKPAGVYAPMVRQIAGADAVALAFYGLAVTGRFDPTRQPARNVLVLEKVDLNVLRRISEQGSKLARTGIAAPVVMTPAYIQASQDTFPLELMEIQQQQVLLFGRDCFAELAFQDEHVRMQCERELKAALIGMHRGVLASAGRDRAIHPLAMDAVEGLVRVLRGILWLRGTREAMPADQMVGAVEQAVARELPAVRHALSTSAQQGWDAFQQLYHDVNVLGEIVDAW